jgi:hypothetical protein
MLPSSSARPELRFAVISSQTFRQRGEFDGKTSAGTHGASEPHERLAVTSSSTCSSSNGRRRRQISLHSETDETASRLSSCS